MILLGCKPAGRNTEQHDVFVGVGENLKSLVPAINAFWPEAKGKIHIDAWREVNYVDEYLITVEPRHENSTLVHEWRLFFINLGGYKKDMFEEYHHKILVVASSLGEVHKNARNTEFFKTAYVSNSGGASHIDDRYGMDVDDVGEVMEMLPLEMKNNFSISITKSVDSDRVPDEIHIGYLPLSKL